jgi:hypothetical protein
MFMKLIHLAKMTWMFTWRWLFIDAIIFKGGTDEKALLIGFLLAAVIIVVFNKTLLTWPLVRLVLRKRVIIPANSWGSDGAVPGESPKKASGPAFAPPKNFRSPELEGTTITSAIEKGRITGYEPTTLETERPKVPDTPHMTGAPGAGLHNASEMDEINIELGVRGEENFARALAKADLINRFETIWSVPVPDYEHFQLAHYQADIDCVLATNDTIYLVDLKNYKSGAVRYYHKEKNLYCEDTMTGQQVGAVKTMSVNMYNATNALRNHFPGVSFTPVVVFMPTDKGEGFIDNVLWPGGIPAMNLSQFLYKAKTEPDFSQDAPHAGAVRRIKSLLFMTRKSGDGDYSGL